MKYLILAILLLCSCNNSSVIREKESYVDTTKVEVKAVTDTTVTDTTENKIPITFDVQLEDWENFNK